MSREIIRPSKKLRSRVLRCGYINVYSRLSPQEERGLVFKEKYKHINPSWDDSFVLLCKMFGKEIGSRRNIRVLDYGCGQGNYVIDEFRDQLSYAVGVDVSKESVSNNICLDEVILLQEAKLPFGDSSFDHVFCLFTFEHLPNPKEALGEMHRVLKRGGCLFFVTPNLESAIVAIKNFFPVMFLKHFLNWAYGREERSVFPACYKANRVSELKRLFEQAGFRESNIFKNYDPSYTSFEQLTFFISNLLDRGLSSLGLSLTKCHLVGWAKKVRS